MNHGKIGDTGLAERLAAVRQALAGIGLVEMEKTGENDFGRKQQARPPPFSDLGGDKLEEYSNAAVLKRKRAKLINATSHSRISERL